MVSYSQQFCCCRVLWCSSYNGHKSRLKENFEYVKVIGAKPQLLPSNKMFWSQYSMFSNACLCWCYYLLLFHQRVLLDLLGQKRPRAKWINASVKRSMIWGYVTGAYHISPAMVASCSSHHRSTEASPHLPKFGLHGTHDWKWNWTSGLKMSLERPVSDIAEAPSIVVWSQSRHIW